eukprot:GHVU01187121.1.p2 GENE.GHVU01187121.1~~GHVU01187121.1.p2  ORF type:complete len:121 (+),score=13.65 GHVU01187121.1:196-558(+)
MYVRTYEVRTKYARSMQQAGRQAGSDGGIRERLSLCAGCVSDRRPTHSLTHGWTLASLRRTSRARSASTVIHDDDDDDDDDNEPHMRTYVEIDKRNRCVRSFIYIYIYMRICINTFESSF